MPKHLRLLETLRNSSTGLKEIAQVIDQAIIDIEKIEESTPGTKESALIMAELTDTINGIKKDRKN